MNNKEDLKSLRYEIQAWALLILVIILILSGFLYFQMPKEVCEYRIETETIILGNMFERINEPEMHSLYITEKAEYLCDGDVEIDDLRTINSIWFIGTDSVCVLKNYFEVCEIK